MNVGEVAWDKMFAEGSFDLPPTRFMEKVKRKRMKRITFVVEITHTHRGYK